MGPISGSFIPSGPCPILKNPFHLCTLGNRRTDGQLCLTTKLFSVLRTPGIMWCSSNHSPAHYKTFLH